MKYTHPAYVSEKIETTDVICESKYTIVHANVTDENGEVVIDPTTGQALKKTVVGIDADKLF